MKATDMNLTARRINSAGLSSATSNGTAATPTMPVYPVADWTLLEPGEIVWIGRGNVPADEGSVDGLMEDGSIVWVCPGGASTRRMVHRSDGDRIWSLRPI